MKKKFVLFSFIILQVISSSLIIGQEMSTVAFAGGDICVEEEDWVLVFHDDFDGDELDRESWWSFFASGTTTPNSVFSRAFDIEGTQQIYLDDNIVVENGFLKVLTKKETATWMGVTKPYTSGTIYSKKKFRDYTKYEMRAKVPCEEGVVSAFWLFGWTTEIDIFEALGRSTDELKMSVHEFPVDTDRRETNTTDVPIDNFCGVYRTYAAEYSAFKVDFLVDGEIVFSFPRYYSISGDPVYGCNVSPGIYLEHPNFPRFGDPLSIIAGMGVGNGGFFGEPNDNTDLPAIMEIDYISAFQLEPKAGVSIEMVQANPNPTTGLFKLRKTENISTLNLSKINVSSIFGEQILEIKYNGESEIDLDISNVPIGIYLITFIDTTGSIVTSIKILKN